MSQIRKHRTNAPFLKGQEAWIILEYGAVRNITQVRRNFRKHFHPVQQHKVPSYNAFKRLVERFITTDGELRPLSKNGGHRNHHHRRPGGKGEEHGGGLCRAR